MGLSDINNNNQNTRAEFNQNPDILNIIKLKTDNLKITQIEVVAKLINIGNGFHLDSTRNGVMGLWNLTMNSKDLFLGPQNEIVTNKTVQDAVLAIEDPTESSITTESGTLLLGENVSTFQELT